MSEKKIEKVCIDCINANEHLKISSDFKVSVEYGTCDCCGKRYMVVPFRRFFSENVDITPCTEIENCNRIADDKQLKKSKNDSWVKPIAHITELQKEQSKQIEDLQNQIKEMLAKTVTTKEETSEKKDLNEVYE